MLESPQFLFRPQSRRTRSEPSRRLSARCLQQGVAAELLPVERRAGREAAGRRAERQTRHPIGIGARKSIGCSHSPRLEAGLRAFFADMLQFDLFDTLGQGLARSIPKWTCRSARMRRSRLCARIVDHAAAASTATIATCSPRGQTFLTPPLGSIYRRAGRAERRRLLAAIRICRRTIRAPASMRRRVSSRCIRTRAELADAARQGAARDLLCQPVPAPPGNVNFAVAQDTHNPHFKTMRERLTAHRTEPTCAGCHKLIDPIGLALENFDSDAGLPHRRERPAARHQRRARRHTSSPTPPGSVARCTTIRRPARASCAASIPMRPDARRRGATCRGSATSRRIFAADGYRVPGSAAAHRNQREFLSCHRARRERRRCRDLGVALRAE